MKTNNEQSYCQSAHKVIRTVWSFWLTSWNNEYQKYYTQKIDQPWEIDLDGFPSGPCNSVDLHGISFHSSVCLHPLPSDFYPTLQDLIPLSFPSHSCKYYSIHSICFHLLKQQHHVVSRLVLMPQPAIYSSRICSCPDRPSTSLIHNHHTPSKALTRF